MRSRAAILLLAVLLGGCITTPAVDASRRPARWATPVVVRGVGNLHQVDANVYRSEQPDAAGLQAASEQLRVRTVVNLRAYHSDRALATQAGLRNIDFALVPWDIGDEDVVAVLRVLHQREDGPFLLHCLYGADRTGVMIAMYRIVEQGWSREEALDEMLHGGYGFHPIFRNLVEYLKRVDVERIRVRVQGQPPAASNVGQAGDGRMRAAVEPARP